MEPTTQSLEEVMEMEVDSPEAAVRFYEQYSRAKGFSMRHGEIVRYTFLCNREGFRNKKWLEMPDRKREHKAITRCRCGADMSINKPKGNSGHWYVSRVVDSHNHELLPAKFVDHLPSFRKIYDVDVAHMDSLQNVGISIPKIYESIASQADGFNYVPFKKRDMYNVVRCQKASCNGDVNATLRYFVSCAVSDHKMYWRYQLNPDKNLCDLF